MTRVKKKKVGTSWEKAKFTIKIAFGAKPFVIRACMVELRKGFVTLQ